MKLLTESGCKDMELAAYKAGMRAGVEAAVREVVKRQSHSIGFARLGELQAVAKKLNELMGAI